jgi:hypothetical protein
MQLVCEKPVTQVLGFRMEIRLMLKNMVLAVVAFLHFTALQSLNNHRIQDQMVIEKDGELFFGDGIVNEEALNWAVNGRCYHCNESLVVEDKQDFCVMPCEQPHGFHLKCMFVADSFFTSFTDDLITCPACAQVFGSIDELVLSQNMIRAIFINKRLMLRIEFDLGPLAAGYAKVCAVYRILSVAGNRVVAQHLKLLAYF